MITKGNKTLSGILKRVRDQTKKGVGVKGAKIGGEASLDLKGSGGISGKYTITRDQAVFTSDGSVKGKLDLDLEAKIEGKLEVLWITAEAGAKLSAETGVSAELKVVPKEDKFEYEGDIRCSGLVIKYAVYAKLEIVRDSESTVSIDEDDRDLGVSSTKKASIEKNDEAKADGEIVLLQPFSLLPELGGEQSSFRGRGATGSWDNKGSGASSSWDNEGSGASGSWDNEGGGASGSW